MDAVEQAWEEGMVAAKADANPRPSDTVSADKELLNAFYQGVTYSQLDMAIQNMRMSMHGRDDKVLEDKIDMLLKIQQAPMTTLTIPKRVLVGLPIACIFGGFLGIWGGDITWDYIQSWLEAYNHGNP